MSIDVKNLGKVAVLMGSERGHAELGPRAAGMRRVARSKPPKKGIGRS